VVESILERLKREHKAATKERTFPDVDAIRSRQEEEFKNAAAWIRVAQIRGRPLTLREQMSLNI
jgi:hypothetical protein